MRIKSKLLTLSIAFLLVFAVFASSCLGKEKDEPNDTVYTIMYNNGVKTETLQVKYGEVYSVNGAIPQKVGYEFLGYFDKENGGTQYISSLGMSVKPFEDRKNIILYPQFKANTYTLQLDYGEAEVIGEQIIKVEYGNKIPTLPSDLKINGKTYMTFEGWYTQPNGGQLFVGSNEVSDIILNENLLKIFDSNRNLKLYAGFATQRHKVTFYSQDGQRTLHNTVVDYGTNFSELSLNIKDDEKTVLSWSSSMNGSAFTGQITKDISLYAISYGITVSYNSDGGSFVENKIVKVGDTVALPNVSKENYRFMGWTYNGLNVSEMSAPDKNITLIAKWERTHYSIRFNSNGGGAVSNKNVLIGESFSVPTVSKTGYTFNGWYDSSNIKYEGSVMPEKDLVLTAKWTARKYTITLDANGGNVDVNSKSVEYGSKFNLPVPLRNGYAFNGWYTSVSEGKQVTEINGESINIMADTKDVMLYAQWTKLENYTITFERENCKTDNGYNPTAQGTEKDILAHQYFNLIELELINGIKNTNGTYYVPQGNKLELSVRVLENVGKLPVGAQLGSVNWTVHYLNDDSYIGEVYGTNISGNAIHYGAYYIKLNYTDGSFSEFNGVNFLKDANKNQLIALSIDNDTEKVLKSAEIICVYEIFYDYMTDIFDWGGTKCVSNWRCSTVIQFESR